MPRIGVTVYDVLLSCPGDVTDLIDIVKECIDGFNKLYGKINNIKIELKHWSTDSYPQSGGAAQELLNKQFIHDCDACIALFGNRFGSPTDKYESGTEEEIEDMIKDGKQVFMYFIDRPTNLSTIDLEQYAKVKQFREKYSEDSKGIYCNIKDEHELRKNLSNHLGLYFLSLIDESRSIEKTHPLPNLELMIAGDYKKENHMNFCNCKMIYEKEKLIKEKIESIQKIILLERKTESIDIEEKKDSLISLQGKYNSQLTDLSKIMKNTYEYVEIPKYIKISIKEYCDKKNIIINDEFWNLGNLREYTSTLMLSIMQHNKTLEGLDEEKEKYKLIKELNDNIEEYNGYISWFSNIDAYSYISCYIRNSGTSFDEDIDIKIKIPKNCLVKYDEIPVPDIGCIEEINIYKYVEVMFASSKTSTIKSYSYYPITNYNVMPLPSSYMLGQSTTDYLKKEEEKYKYEIERIFCYEYFEEEDNDILKVNIKYLKQNDSMYLPSILFFKKQPEYIEYEITSKHYPDIKKDRFEFK